MKLYLYLLILGIGLGNLVYGQRTINGIVTDTKTGQPVSLVNLTPDAGSLGTSTDLDGKFSIVVSRLPVSIRFSHIAYEAKILTINKYPEKPIQVKLEPRVEPIGEVVVEGGKYIQMLKRESFFVSEYEFDKDKIWVVGYANKSILQPQLILVSLDGRIIQKQAISGKPKLYRDAFGQVHLLDKESMVRIDYIEDQIRIGEPKMFSGWEQNLFDLQLVLGKSGIFKWVYNNGIYCEYAAVDFSDTIIRIIHKSYDRGLFAGEGPAKTFRHSPIPRIMMGAFGMGGKKYRDIPQFDPSDAFTARAQEQLDYRPIITRIYRFRNSYLIFEDRGCHLWKYDLSFTDPEHLRIAAPKNAKNTDLLQDPVTGSLYLYYTLNGVGELAGVDPLTGAVLFDDKASGGGKCRNALAECRC
ncbi:MAG: carboxypeptidase-like regulatory domain-containing protein [Bacteroidia bacterium]|nr:carboxypeptidase-like regulatory domain-containing protein [Bacteroidia bacterium]